MPLPFGSFVNEEVKESTEIGVWLANASIGGNARKGYVTPQCPSESNFGFFLNLAGYVLWVPTKQMELPSPGPETYMASAVQEWIRGIYDTLMTPSKLLTLSREAALTPLSEA